MPVGGMSPVKIFAPLVGPSAIEAGVPVAVVAGGSFTVTSPVGLFAVEAKASAAESELVRANAALISRVMSQRRSGMTRAQMSPISVCRDDVVVFCMLVNAC